MALEPEFMEGEEDQGTKYPEGALEHREHQGAREHWEHHGALEHLNNLDGGRTPRYSTDEVRVTDPKNI